MVTDTDMVMKKARKKFNVNEDKMITSRENIQQFFLPTFVFRHSITALVSDFAHGMFAKSECAILFLVFKFYFSCVGMLFPFSVNY